MPLAPPVCHLPPSFGVGAYGVSRPKFATPRAACQFFVHAHFIFLASYTELCYPRCKWPTTVSERVVYFAVKHRRPGEPRQFTEFGRISPELRKLSHFGFPWAFVQLVYAAGLVWGRSAWWHFEYLGCWECSAWGAPPPLKLRSTEVRKYGSEKTR